MSFKCDDQEQYELSLRGVKLRRERDIQGGLEKLCTMYYELTHCCVPKRSLVKIDIHLEALLSA